MEHLLLKMVQHNRFSDIQLLIHDLPQVHRMFECYKSLYWDTSHWDELSPYFLTSLKEIFESKEITAKSELADNFTKAAESFSEFGGFGFSLLCAGEAMVQSEFAFQTLIHSKTEMQSNDQKVQKSVDEKIRKYVNTTCYYARALQDFGSVSPYKGKSLTFQKGFLECAITKYEQVLKMNSLMPAVHSQSILRDIICCHVILGKYFRAGFLDLYERFYEELALLKFLVFEIYWVSFFGLFLGLAAHWKSDNPDSLSPCVIYYSVVQVALAGSALVSLIFYGKLPGHRHLKKFVLSTLVVASTAFYLTFRTAVELHLGSAGTCTIWLIGGCVLICSIFAVTVNVSKNAYDGSSWRA